MKSQAKAGKISESQAAQLREQETETSQESLFQDNRSSAALQRKIQADMNGSAAPLQLKKDKAEYVFGDKGEPAGTTATKVINPKSGTRGLYKYKYHDGARIMDTFNGTNIADTDIAKDTDYEGLSAPNISVAVASHDLAGGDSPLSSSKIVNGKRYEHFAHADEEHGIDRTNKYTWHHLQDVGKMELIDMNVHGAMWHYGGISGWAASVHESNDTDDDPAED